MEIGRSVINKNGNNTIEISNIEFSSKRRIPWDDVESYCKRYVGQEYIIRETGEKIYVGSDFPDEYAHSNYSAKAKGTIGKAKANAAQVIPMLIEIATEISHKENHEEKHNKNAKYGWYSCTTRFSLPTTDDKGNVIGRNNFHGRLIIRCGADRRLYLYDLIDIKKET